MSQFHFQPLQAGLLKVDSAEKNGALPGMSACPAKAGYPLSVIERLNYEMRFLQW